MKEHCPKCGPMPPVPTEEGQNPSWYTPAVAETSIFTDTEGPYCHYECSYCQHKWDVKESYFHAHIPAKQHCEKCGSVMTTVEGDRSKYECIYCNKFDVTPCKHQWCAMCGTWGDHTSGSCPELKHLK